MMSEKLYYEVVESGAGFGWKVYRYDSSGNRDIVVARSSRAFYTEGQAADDCCQWQEDNGVDAELR
jgi:hypothetical protein